MPGRAGRLCQHGKPGVALIQDDVFNNVDSDSNNGDDNAAGRPATRHSDAGVSIILLAQPNSGPVLPPRPG